VGIFAAVRLDVDALLSGVVLRSGFQPPSGGGGGALWDGVAVGGSRTSGRTSFTFFTR
jgi:hypothetical protein